MVWNPVRDEWPDLPEGLREVEEIAERLLERRPIQVLAQLRGFEVTRAAAPLKLLDHRVGPVAHHRQLCAVNPEFTAGARSGHQNQLDVATLHIRHDCRPSRGPSRSYVETLGELAKTVAPSRHSDEKIVLCACLGPISRGLQVASWTKPWTKPKRRRTVKCISAGQIGCPR